MQWNKDKTDAENKAKEKMAKIKENLILFNELISKQGNSDNTEITKKKNMNEVL